MPCPAVQARIAVLFSAGSFAVYDLDQSNELRPTLITAGLVSARLGRVADVEWLPLPAPVGESILGPFWCVFSHPRCRFGTAASLFLRLQGSICEACRLSCCLGAGSRAGIVTRAHACTVHAAR
jgi:hypothetical protein